MVEETFGSAEPAKAKTQRPKSVYLWSVADVVKWLRRHCSEECQQYKDNFIHHEITGRALLRLNENTLVRLGVDDPAHRQEIWRGVVNVRLRAVIMDVMDLQRQHNYYE